MRVRESQQIRLQILKAYAREMLKRVRFRNLDLESERLEVLDLISRIPLDYAAPLTQSLIDIEETCALIREGAREHPTVLKKSHKLLVLGTVIFLWFKDREDNILNLDEIEHSLIDDISIGVGLPRIEGRKQYRDYVRNAMIRLNPES